MSLLADVQRLKEHPDLENKLHITRKITGYYNSGTFDQNEKKIALEVIRLLMKDIEVSVRRAVAESLKDSSTVPKDIILSLANDQEEMVAIPVLEVSCRLSQRDLMEIVRSTKTLGKWMAVARRPDIGKSLSRALVATGHEEVAETLLDNTDAELPEDIMAQVIKEYGHSGNIMQALVHRGGLSPALVGQLLDNVADNLKEVLARRYNLSAHVVEQGAAKARAEVALSLIEGGCNTRQTEQLVGYLSKHHQLSNSILLRALCKGDLVFFEMGLAKRAAISNRVAHQLMWDGGPAGFASLYKMAGMPKSMFRTINIILRFGQEEQRRGTLHHPEFGGRMVEQLTAGGYDKKLAAMPYFMVLLQTRLNPVDVCMARQMMAHG